MSVGERDEKMNKLASEASELFVRRYDLGDRRVKDSPETVLQYAVPYLPVRTLHRVRDTLDRQERALDRYEKALKSLKHDSRWINWSAIITVGLTVVLAVLTTVLAFIAYHDYIIRTAPP